jgi:hypothetical protein
MLLHQRLHPADLIERSRRRSKLEDFGDWPFQEGLQVFLRACLEEAELSLFGHLGTRWDVGRLLGNLLRMRAEEGRVPEILDERIERPIFITGLPRSGTTFLHQLMAADPANQVPRVWQLIHPYPTADGSSDRRRQRVARQLRMFRFLSPRFGKMHPIGAESPQECSEITAHIFRSPRFDTTYSVPSYRRWLDANRQLDAFRFHKRFLQHLQYGAGISGRWALKCPDHVFALDEIRAIYPDARYVFVHRDPVQVIVSVAHLTEVLRRPFTKYIDRAALARHEVERWSKGAELMIRAADTEPFAEPICHVHYRELVGDPVRTMQKIYRHFGLTVEPAAFACIDEMLLATANGGYGANRHQFGTYQIEPATIRERFEHYSERFGIFPELKSASRTHAPVPNRYSDRLLPDPAD